MSAFHREKVLSVRHWTDTLFSFTATRNSGFRFLNGQFAMIGLEVDGQAQVSMNLVDTEQTPLHRAYEAVRTEAMALGVTPTWSELVGLIPERVLLDAGVRHVQLRGFSPSQTLEYQIRGAASADTSLAGFVAAVASAVAAVSKTLVRRPRRPARPVRQDLEVIGRQL